MSRHIFRCYLSNIALQERKYLCGKYNHYISITPESEMHFAHTDYESDLIMDQAALGVDTHATFSGDVIT